MTKSILTALAAMHSEVVTVSDDQDCWYEVERVMVNQSCHYQDCMSHRLKWLIRKFEDLLDYDQYEQDCNWEPTRYNTAHWMTESEKTFVRKLDEKSLAVFKKEYKEAKETLVRIRNYAYHYPEGGIQPRFHELYLEISRKKIDKPVTFGDLLRLASDG